MLEGGSWSDMFGKCSFKLFCFVLHKGLSEVYLCYAVGAQSGKQQPHSSYIRVLAERIGSGALGTYGPIERAGTPRSVKVPLDPRITRVGRCRR